MPGLRRFSSRRQRLGASFLAARLSGARAYDRIAGYFSSSILEAAGEALESVAGPIRVVCNSGLSPGDVETARAAQAALRQEWCASGPERLVDAGGDAARRRFSRLHEFLSRGRLQVRVLPEEKFGLAHGKAGVITLADGRKTCFLGSANESKAGWFLHYELLWEDESPESVAWVQEEFDALWTSPFAVPLAEFVAADIGRISRRAVLGSVEEWRKGVVAAPGPEPAPVFVEAPVYRSQAGLWEHQKHFVKLAFDAHRDDPGGARFVLADQVGLGKTVQLAMTAQLIALTGEKPVLILAPKTLLGQWQGEMQDLLDLPSARWNGRQWVDEAGTEHPAWGPEGILRCPRRIGIVSTGLVSRRSEPARLLQEHEYDCVIVDEAHRARRRNLGHGRDDEKPDPNNLLAFLHEISPRTRSMLLATATPVQLRPIEAWDLLDALSRGAESVLGNAWSRWRTKPREAVELVAGRAPLPADDADMWEWVRSPLPPRREHTDFEALRRSLDLEDGRASAPGDALDRLRPPDRARLRGMFARFVSDHNPFIRHIVRRSRDYLEQARSPETGEPYLRRIAVRLWGEGEDEALRLPPYLREAYSLAEEFCRLLGARMAGSGIIKTLLLRRVGSTMAAGRSTAAKMLAEWGNVEDWSEEDDDDVPEGGAGEPGAKTLKDEERKLLERFTAALDANRERDPKYAAALDYLKTRGWLQQGCIVFSQYLDSARWIAERLARDIPDETLGLYAGSAASGIYEGGAFRTCPRDDIKERVRRGTLRLLVGTDAASEGINLQRLGTLINLDLPWNPTRLEQRKGRIQRIGQPRDTVDILNLRYSGSVEDRVHQMLSARFQDIHRLFGQLPDVLEDAWIEAAIGDNERARRRIGDIPARHPFDVRYREVRPVDWESCARVLSPQARRDCLRRGWS